MGAAAPQERGGGIGILVAVLCAVVVVPLVSMLAPEVRNAAQARRPPRALRAARMKHAAWPRCARPVSRLKADVVALAAPDNGRRALARRRGASDCNFAWLGAQGAPFDAPSFVCILNSSCEKVCVRPRA
jgi:hypothetical protein